MTGLVCAQESFKRVLKIVVFGSDAVEVQPGYGLGCVFLGRDRHGRVHLVERVLRYPVASDDASGQPFPGTEYVDFVPLLVQVMLQDAVVSSTSAAWAKSLASS